MCKGVAQTGGPQIFDNREFADEPSPKGMHGERHYGNKQVKEDHGLVSFKHQTGGPLSRRLESASLASPAIALRNVVRKTGKL